MTVCLSIPFGGFFSVSTRPFPFRVLLFFSLHVNSVRSLLFTEAKIMVMFSFWFLKPPCLMFMKRFSLTFFFFKFWLYWVFVVACGLLSSCPEACGCMTSSPTRDWTHAACIGRRILNHWITREVSNILKISMVVQWMFLKENFGHCLFLSTLSVEGGIFTHNACAQHFRDNLALCSFSWGNWENSWGKGSEISFRTANLEGIS